MKPGDSPHLDLERRNIDVSLPQETGKGKGNLSSPTTGTLFPKVCRVPSTLTRHFARQLIRIQLNCLRKFSKIQIYLIVSLQLDSGYYIADVSFAKLFVIPLFVMLMLILVQMVFSRSLHC